MSEENQETKTAEEPQEQAQEQQAANQPIEAEKDIDAKFVEASCKMAKESVGYQIERNIPKIIKDMDEQRHLTGELGMTATIKVTFYRASKYSLKITGCVVSYVQKRQYKDEDFCEQEVDFDQPKLPGFEEAIAESEAKKENEIDADGPVFLGGLRNAPLQMLLQAAAEHERNVYFACTDVRIPNHDRTIFKYNSQGETWTKALAPRTIDEIFRIAENDGDYVIDLYGSTTARTTINMINDGLDVRGILGFKLIVKDDGELSEKKMAEANINKKPLIFNTYNTVISEITMPNGWVWNKIDLSRITASQLPMIMMDLNQQTLFPAKMRTRPFVAIRTFCLGHEIVLIYIVHDSPDYYVFLPSNNVFLCRLYDAKDIDIVIKNIRDAVKNGPFLTVEDGDFLPPESVKRLAENNQTPKGLNISETDISWTDEELQMGVKY